MDWIRATFEAFRERTLCVEGERGRAGRDFLETMDRAAEAVDAADLPPRAPLAVEAETAFGGLAALLGLAGRRLALLPLPAELPEAERSRQLEIAGASHALTPANDGFRVEPRAGGAPDAAPPRALRRLEERDGAGLVLFSSGSTGAPKGMVHDFPRLLAPYRDLRPREERALLLLLVDHIGGLDAAFRALFAGSTLIVPERREPEAAGAAIERHRVTVLPASPTFLNLMLLAGIPDRCDCSSVRVVAYGAEPMPRPLLRRVSAAFPRAQLQQKFGTSETGAIRVKGTAREDLNFSIEDPGTEWKVVDGELWLRTPARILGYLNAPEDALDDDGWYRTGDLVDVRDDGSIRVRGRLGDMINVGGRKVHPSEIEAVLGELPEVAACRVRGVDDPIAGNAIAAEIVPSDPADADPRAWKKRLRARCRGTLAPWQIPARVAIRETLDINRRLKG